MEPLFFKAENASSRINSCPVYCFNGAAFFQSGNGGFYLPPDAYRRGFKEPLFFKAENKFQKKLELSLLTASMEPLFFKAENLHNETPGERFWRFGFNGAAFFQSGKYGVVERATW